MAADASALPARWTPQLLSLARIIFGFLLFRHGMEQVIGFPPAWVPSESTSFYGVIKLLAFPGGILIMLGLLLRPVCLVLSAMYLAYWFVGPLSSYLTEGARLFGARGPSDPVLLNGLFFLYLALAGGGAWSLDRLRDSKGEAVWESPWAPYALAVLRIVAGFLFIFHGIDKVTGRVPLDLTSLRALAAALEFVGGPLLMAGLFTRPVAFILSGEMAFAYFLNHWPERFWGSFVEPNQEAAILNSFLFLFLWGAGPGAWSLDGMRRPAARNSRLATDTPTQRWGPDSFAPLSRKDTTS